MFTQRINNTPLLGDDLSDLINVWGDDIAGDRTFVSTLRALLYNRIGQGSVQFIYKKCYINELHATDVAGWERTVCQCLGKIILVELSVSSDIVLKTIYDDLDNNKELELQEKISTFYRKIFPVRCYLNKKTQSSIVIVIGLSIKNMHYLQCSIPAMLPWYFTDKTLSSLELELLKSLQEKSSHKYLEISEQIYRSLDTRKKHIEITLPYFLKNSIQSQIDDCIHSVQSSEEHIRTLNLKIKEELEKMSKKKTLLAGFRQALQEERTDIVEYILSQDNIFVVSSTETILCIGIRTPVLYYDADMCKSVLENRNSYIYTIDGLQVSRDLLKRLLDEIFIQQKIKLWLYAGFEISGIGYVEPVQDTNWYKSIGFFSHCIPNPHIDTYGCMGDHLVVLNEMALDRDYIQIVEQCRASAASINFADSVVVRNLIYTWGSFKSQRTIPCLEMPDGRFLDIEDAMKYLEKEYE